MTIIIYKKLTLKESLEFMPIIEKWFKDNPKKKFCQTEHFKVRRGFVATDMLAKTHIKKACDDCGL